MWGSLAGGHGAKTFPLLGPFLACVRRAWATWGAVIAPGRSPTGRERRLQVRYLAEGGRATVHSGLLPAANASL